MTAIVFDQAKVTYADRDLNCKYNDDHKHGNTWNGVADSGAGFNIVFHNRSFRNIAVMSGSGMVVNLPATSAMDNVLSVRETFQLGRDATFHWGKIEQLCRGEDKAFLQKVKQTVDRHLAYSPVVTVTIYYDVDLTDLEGYPNGIVIGETSYQVIDMRNIDAARPHARLAVLSQSALVQSQSKRAPNSIVQNIEYYIQHPGQAPAAYVQMFLNNWELIVPLVDPNKKPGLHRTVISNSVVEYVMGPDGKIQRQPKRDVSYIPISDFAKMGIVTTVSDLFTALNLSKYPDKKHLDQLLKSLGKALDSQNPDKVDNAADWAERVADVEMLGISLNKMAALASKLTKVFKEVKGPINEF